MKAPADAPSFFQRESLHVAVVIAAAVLLALNWYAVTVDRPAERKSEAAEPALPGLPPTLSEKLEGLREAGERFRSLDPAERIAAIREEPRTFIALALVGLFVLAIAGIALLGVVVLVWFLIRIRKGAEIFTAESSEKPQWSIWEFLIVFGVAIVLTAVLDVVVSGASVVLPLFAEQPARIVFVAVPAEVLACVYAARLLWRRYRHRLDAVGLTARNFGRNVGIGLLGYAASYPFILLTALASYRVAEHFGQSVAENPAIARLGGEDTSALLTLLAAFSGAAIIPVIEEFLFRGLLYGALRRRFGPASSIILSAAVFATFHFNLYQFLPLFTMGAAMAYLFEKTRSLVAPCAFHIVQNSMVMLFLLVLRFLA